MSDQEFTAWLKSLPREKSEQDVARAERRRNAARGEWINPHEFPNRYGKAAH